MDVVTIEANLIDGNRIVGNPTFLGLPGLDVERSEVPRAGDGVALKLTVRERTPLVRARREALKLLGTSRPTSTLCV